MNNKNGFRSEIIGISYLSTILELENIYLTNPSLCLKSNSETIEESLKSHCSVGVFNDKNVLIAYSLMYINEYYLGFVDKCFVLPEYRGKDIQNHMLNYNISSAILNGCHRIFAMCSPYNEHSLKNFMYHDFKIIDALMIEGQRRLILERKML